MRLRPYSARMKLHSKHLPTLTTVLMVCTMVLFMSFIMTAINRGFAGYGLWQWLGFWMRSYAVGVSLAIPIAFTLGGPIRRLAERFVHQPA